MKKLRSILLIGTLLVGGLTFTNVGTVNVYAQGQQDSKSKGPSSSTLSDEELAYLLWLLLMLLIWGG